MGGGVGDAMGRRVAALVLRAGAFGVLAFLTVGVWPVFGQSAVAPVITSEGPFVVVEGSTSVATLTASDTDTAVADLVWSKAGGADAAVFVLSGSGVLAFTAVKDFEEPDDADTDGVYELTVQVSDGDSDVTAGLAVTVINTVELTAIVGPSDVVHRENWAGRVATYSASSTADEDGLVWSLSGVDAAHFSIESPGGALRFGLAASGVDLFSPLPDFDSPLDDDADGTYAVTVHAGGGGDQQSLDVEVTVSDEPEPGMLVLSTTRPQLGDAITATLTDPDGVTGTVSYVWERSVGRGTWATLASTGASHTATAADTGSFLRVTASYQDGHPTANTATAGASEVVTADLLTALTVTTTDSVANVAHALRPSFDAGILHYSIGCAASNETMTLTPTAASGVRLSIDGTQVASGESRTIDVDRSSEVRVTLAGASGAATTYFLRCLSGDLLDMTVTTESGATGVIEDLIIFGVDKFGERSIAIVDASGAVRFHRKDASWRGGYFRAAWVSALGEYRYAYHKRGGSHWQILNEGLEVVDQIATVAPLSNTDGHDITLLDDGNYIVMAYEPIDRDLSGLTFGTFGTSVRMRDSAIQIRTPGGSALFTWKSYDAIPLEDCFPNFPPDQADYAHINTLQMVDGDIVASFRGCNTVLRIDPDLSGDHKVVWRLARSNLSDEQWDGLDKGPPPLDIIGDAEGQFCGQHGSELFPNGHLTLFDNGVLCMDDPWLNEQLVPRPGGEYSRAVEYALDLDNNEAVFLRDHSLGGTRTRIGYVTGHVETLGNGDWLVSWGGAAGNTATRRKPNKSVTQVDPNTGEEKFSIFLPQSGSVAHSLRGVPLSPVALANVLPPLEARVVAGDHSSVTHEGTEDRPTVAVAFNRPVADFTTTASVTVTGAAVEGIAALVEAGAPAHTYVFTLAPGGDTDIDFSLIADKACDADPPGVCTSDGTTLSVVPATSHTIAWLATEPVNSQPEFAATETGIRSVAENTTAGEEIGTAISAGDDDGDDLDYSISGADAAAFALDSSSGQLSTKDPLDYETKDSYSFALSVRDSKDDAGDTDNATDDTIEVTVTVTDVNEQPVISGQAEVHYSEEGTGDVASYSAADPDSDMILWTLEGDDHSSFEISSLGALAFKTPPDYETRSDNDGDNDYQVTVRAWDGNSYGTLDVVVTVTPVDEAPVVTVKTGSTIQNYAENGTGVVASFSATDPEGEMITWSPAGNDADDFELSTAGVLTFREVPDREDPTDSDPDNVYEVTVRAWDGNSYGTLDVVVTVTNINEAAVISGDASLDYAENRTSTVASYSASDPEGSSVTLSLAGTDMDDLNLSAGGALTFSQTPNYESPLDSNRNNEYLVTVRAWDGNSYGTLDVVVTVTNENEDGTVTLSSPQPQVGTELEADLTDPDGSVTSIGWVWARSATSSGGWSTISGATSNSYEPVDADLNNYLRATASYDDGEGSGKTAQAESENQVQPAPVMNTAPEFPTSETGRREVEENTPSGETIGDPVAAEDPDIGDTLTYKLEGTDAAAFDMDESSGQLRTKAALDYEGKRSYSMTLTVTDTSGEDDSITVRVSVTNFDEPPDLSGPAAVDYDENRGGTVGSYTTVDPERANIDWTLAGDDLDDFRISSRGVLTFTATPDYEAPTDSGGDNTYEVIVQASDGTNTPTQAVTVRVTNLDEEGTVTLTTTTSRPQVNTAISAALDDPDGGIRNLVWEWSRSTNRRDWTPIPATDTASYTPTSADIGQYLQATATYDDDEGTTKIAAAHTTSTVLDPTRPPPPPPPGPGGGGGGGGGGPVEDAGAPTFDEDSRTVRSVPENSPAGTNVGAAVKATDPDDDPLTYKLAGTDADAFDLDTETGQLKTKTPLDYETKNSYTVTVEVRDNKDAEGEPDRRRDDSIRVAIVIGNRNDAGWLTLSAPTPRVNKTLQAALADVDGGIIDIAWKWERSTDQNTWTPIPDATTNGYTPTPADADQYLRVTVTYGDPFSLANTATATPGAAVAEGHTTIYTDVTPEGTHTPAIDALAADGLFVDTECGHNLFCPYQPIQRWTMAIWLIRILGGDPPTIGLSRFEDVPGGQWWIRHVEHLADRQITLGCTLNPPRYCPNKSVTRAQMASFLVRAFQLAPAQTPAGFTDTQGNVHTANIDTLATAGITVGCTTEPLQYCPNQPVTRAQMATFLHRALKHQPEPDPTSQAFRGPR